MTISYQASIALVQNSQNTGSLMTIPDWNAGMQRYDNDFYRVLCLFMDRECVFMLACLFVCSLPKVQDLTVFLFKCSLNTIWRFVCMLSFINFSPYSLFVVLIGEGAKIGNWPLLSDPHTHIHWNEKTFCWGNCPPSPSCCSRFIYKLTHGNIIPITLWDV